MRSMVIMSRVGKKPIQIPSGVEVKIEGQKVIVKGPKGELKREVRPEINVEVKDSQIFVQPKLAELRSSRHQGETGDEVKPQRPSRALRSTWAVESKQTKAFWGLTRALLQNMVLGVKEGYEKKLEIEGLGFKAILEGQNLVLSVGFSHPVKIEAPEGIKFSVEKNIITVSGSDKELVGQTAANIRKVKKPEPYKGKGIKYAGEVIRRKVGKKAAAAETK